MSTASPVPLPLPSTPTRRLPKQPHIPGAFDTEGESLDSSYCNPVDLIMEDAQGDPPKTDPAADHRESSLQTDDHAAKAAHDDSASSLPPLPNNDNSLLPPSEDGDRSGCENQTLMEENEMRKKLMEMESSFLREPSTIDIPAAGQSAGADDTYLFGVPGGDTTEPGPEPPNRSFEGEGTSDNFASVEEQDQNPLTPRAEAANNTTMDAASATPSEYQEGNTSMLERMESSPAAEAARRIGGRDPSTYSESTRDGGPTQEEAGDKSMAHSEELQPTLRPFGKDSANLSPTQSKTSRDAGDAVSVSDTSSRRGYRPKYLNSRQSAHRLSSSSATTNNSETTSDANLGADYALQSGGAAPGPAQWQHNSLTRSVSLGSVASGVSGYGDENPLQKKNSVGRPEGLETLEEEGPPLSNIAQEDSPDKGPSPPATPKARPPNNFPTETAVAERIKEIQVPSTFAKQFLEDHGSSRGLSPDKRTAATPAFARSGRSMTLKEQSSTIDRLSKENFDLKMRIHFLSEALNKRSEEGIKEMISENVELKSDKLKLQKDNQGLRRKIRDMEKQLRDHQSDKESMANHDPDGSDDDRGQRDEETYWLRERVETYEHEIEKLRSESLARESEKRRLAEMVKSLSDGRPIGSDVGAREERVSVLQTWSFPLTVVGYVERHARRRNCGS